MPLLDKLTLKNPILLWIQKKGFLQPKIAITEDVTKQFGARKQYWLEKKANKEEKVHITPPADRVTLTDKFLDADAERGPNMELSPFNHSHTMIVAGSETTAITASSIFYYLLKNPRCYNKLQEEIDAVTLDIAQEVFPNATTQAMPYLNACIDESMRLHTVTRIPHDRLVPPGGLEIAGHHVPEGTDVGVYGTVLQRHAGTFGDDVDVFRPERWLESEEKARHMHNAMFTFSAGKYSCLGKNLARMEISKLVPTVIRAFEVGSPIRTSD